MQRIQQIVRDEARETIMGPPHWQDGICSCADDFGVCCQTIWCLPCTVSNILSMRETLMPTFDCYHCFCVSVLTYATYYFPFVLTMAVRRELIQRYGIQGESQCSSCCISTWCAPCVACQVQREMGKRKEHVGGCCAVPPSEQPSMMDRLKQNAAKTALGLAETPRFWGSGLFQCAGGADCCEGFFCGCCISGFQGAKLDAHRVPGAPTHEHMDPIACCGSITFGLVGWWYANRRELIERYSIVGENHIMSFFKVVCCPFCALLQQRREMGYNGEWPGGICVKTAPARPYQAAGR